MVSNATSHSAASAALPAPDTAMLEMLIPGYTLLSKFCLSYLHVDITAYLQYFIGFALLAAASRYMLRNCWTMFRQYLVCTAEIRLDDEVFHYFMYWMSRQPFMKQTHRFVAGIKSNGYWTDNEDSEPEDFNDDESLDPDAFEKYLARRKKLKTLRYTPSEGRHLFWYRGRPIILEREYKDLTTRWVLNNERLYLSCFGWSSSIIKSLMLEAQKTYIDRDRNRTVIYRAQKYRNGAQLDWARCMARRPRPMSTVILDQGQKDAFISDMKDYLRRETWYTDRGIPYRRGYLFHGPPGTGKTSLCFAVAGRLRLTLYILSLSSKALDDDTLMTLFSELPRQCLVLLEDVDSAGITQNRVKSTKASKKDDPSDSKSDTDAGAEDAADDKSSEKEGITLSGLLNVMDGVAASEGRILVMTTNHRDKLDEALTRDGRVDMEVEFGYTTRVDIEQLFTSIYLPDASTFSHGRSKGGKKLMMNGVNGVNGTAHHTALPDEKSPRANGVNRQVREKTGQDPCEVLRPRITALSTEFGSIVPSGELTAAEIQGYLLNHKNSPESAVKGAEAWVQTMRKRKGLVSEEST